MSTIKKSRGQYVYNPAGTLRDCLAAALRDMGVEKFEIIPLPGGGLEVRVPSHQAEDIADELIHMEGNYTIKGYRQGATPPPAAAEPGPVQTLVDQGLLTKPTLTKPMLDVSAPIFTTTGLTCRLLCGDLDRTLDGIFYPVVVAVKTDRGELLCICTNTGETRNGLFNITNNQDVEAEKKAAFSWEEYGK